MLPKYYGTQEQLTEQENYRLKKYCRKTIFERFENFLLDPAIYTPVNLDCRNCHSVHPSTCCEDGQPYSMTTEAEKELSVHVRPILEASHDSERIQQYDRVGFLEVSERTNGVSTIRKCDGNCLFYITDNQSGFCSIHRYAEQNHFNHMQLKPFSCSLFPLDIIEMDEQIMITALTPETMRFSRWGTEYEDYLCVNLKLRENKDLPDHLFPPQLYQPAWISGEGLLKITFGEELIDAIRNMQKRP